MSRGDRLRVERRLVGTAVTYGHHGIDLGDGTVVHARPDDFREPFGGGRVERTSLAEFAAGARVQIDVDPPARFPPDVVAARALGQVGREGYCPVIDNCEHFATWCATGRRTSRQVDVVLSRIAGSISRVATAVSARGVARAATTAAETLAARAALGGTVRLGLRTLVPAAVAAEAVALAAEWTAQQSGRSTAESRAAGEAAGMATSAAVCGLAGLAAGPVGVVAAAAAGAAVWVAGGLATRVVGAVAARHVPAR